MYLKKTLELSDDYSSIIEVFRKAQTNNDAAWECADFIYAEIKNPNFRFSLSEFASMLGVSKGLISQYKNAAAFDKIHHFDRKKYTVSHVYILSTLKDDYQLFLDSMSLDDPFDPSELPVSKLRKEVKDFKESLIDSFSLFDYFIKD